jgi:Arc/MetJ-type ribon-helix-helix transcriptional regulator
MSIDLNPEDQQKAEALVASGRFDTVADALHAGLEALKEDADWQAYASDRIEAGWADMEAGRTTPWEEVEAWLKTTMQKRA